MISETKLKIQLEELFENNVFGTIKNDEFKNILSELIGERKKLKGMIKETQNDMELGKLVRSYFINEGIYSKNV
jgi:hypothetical protein